MFLNFKSLAEVRNQSEKQQISVFANGIGLDSQGRYSFINHLLNVYHVSDSTGRVMQRWKPGPALQGPSVKWGDRPGTQQGQHSKGS